MQLIPPTHVARPARGPLVLSTLVGGVLLFGGLGLAWLAIATPVVRGLTPAVVRPAPDQMLMGALVWGLSLVAPPAFAIVGAIRLSSVAATVLRKPHVGAVKSVAARLGDEYVVAPIVNLPDGRTARNVVVGPFGMAILHEMPPKRFTRRHGSQLEVRRHDGRWVSLESPLERAIRDTDRLKHWLTLEERDFVVKVYAAVVTDDDSIARTPSCAVLLPDQIPGWLASLPPQRSLSPSRIEDLVERLRAIA
jgi:hypothetical protein